MVSSVISNDCGVGGLKGGGGNVPHGESGAVNKEQMTSADREECRVMKIGQRSVCRSET